MKDAQNTRKNRAIIYETKEISIFIIGDYYDNFNVFRMWQGD